MLTAIAISTLSYAAYEVLSYPAARHDEQDANAAYNRQTAELARKCGTVIRR